MNLCEFPGVHGPLFVNPGIVVSVHTLGDNPEWSVITTSTSQHHVVLKRASAVRADLGRAVPTTEALVDMAQNLYSMAAPFMRDTDEVWRAMQEQYAAAMRLAGRDPKI